VKPAPKDTVAKVKQAGKTKAATPKIKIAKEQTSGGEVVPVIEVSKPCDTVTKFVATFDPLRDDSIRLVQHKIDSLDEALAKTSMMAEMRRRVAAAELSVRNEELAKKEAEALA